jgi:hypothetical protein
MNTANTLRLLASAGIVLGLAACETVAEEATEAIGFEYTAMLRPASGSTSGKAEVSLNDATNMLCTDLELSSGVTMTSGGIYGPGGALVADIDRPEGDKDSDDCDNITDAQLDGIKANPGAYTVRINATPSNLSGVLVKEA